MKASFKYLLGIVMILLISMSCNVVPKDIKQKDKCNKKLEKLIIKCPNLVQLDTIRDTIEVEVPKIEIKDSLVLSVDTAALDSLLKEYNVLLSKKDKIKFIETFRNSITIDTLILDSLYKLKITLSNGVLSYDIEIYQRTIKEPIETITRSVSIDKLTWWESTRLYLGKWFRWIIIVCVTIILLWFLNKIFNPLKK